MTRKNWRAVARGLTLGCRCNRPLRGSDTRSFGGLVAALLLSACAVACGTSSACGPTASQSSPATANLWLSGGNDLHNTRFQPSENLISPSNVGTLAPKWVQTVAGDVSATPTTDGKSVYFPDWSGNLNALDAATGEVVWQKSVANYLGIPGVSRTSPAIVDNGASILIGAPVFGGPPARLVKIDSQTGAALWATTVDQHPAATISSNPGYAENTVIVGVASSEEAFAGNANYPCCSFRGSVVAVDATTGGILWKTYLEPDNGGLAGGYSGAAVWGSTPMIDVDRGLVYVATGNNYSIPPSAAACELLTPDNAACYDPDNHIDSVVALDLSTGAIRWTYQATYSDISNNGCLLGVNCESPRGPDDDFAQAPLLVDGPAGQEVFVGQKSGIGYAFNPDTGALLWQTHVGSQLMWGSASDGCRIYVADQKNLAGTAGAWSALNPTTGKILWTTNDPGKLSDHAVTVGPVTVANGVVYGSSEDVNGATMFGLDAATGKILFSFNSGSSVAGGASVANGVVYWGSGYSKFSSLTGNQKIFAFTPAGQ